MWPNKRVQSSALMRWQDDSAAENTGRAKVVRKRDTRRMVRATVPAQRKGGSK